MASILNIETSTQLCSVAFAVDGIVLSMRETLEDKSHAAKLTVFIEEILKEQHLSVADIDAVAVGKGPGSYTGLRIGVSTAKGLCYGAQLPLIALNTLDILVKQVLTDAPMMKKEEFHTNNFLLCPMIDARRMEVFTSLYNHSGIEIEPVAAKIIAQDTFHHYLDEQRVVFFGSGMEKCREVLAHPNAVFISDIHPHCASLAFLAEEKFHQKLFEDVAYFEPFYLKDFIATVSKKGLMV